MITPPDNKSMTNEVIRAVVITGKYAVQSSPREKRNMQCLNHQLEEAQRGLISPTRVQDVCNRESVKALRDGFLIIVDHS